MDETFPQQPHPQPPPSPVTAPLPPKEIHKSNPIGMRIAVAATILTVLCVAGFLEFRFIIKKQAAAVTTYAECINNGGSTVQTSYPAVCVTSDGKRFTQPITTEEQQNLRPPTIPDNWQAFSFTGCSTRQGNFEYIIRVPDGWTSSKTEDNTYRTAYTVSHDQSKIEIMCDTAGIGDVICTDNGTVDKPFLNNIGSQNGCYWTSDPETKAYGAKYNVTNQYGAFVFTVYGVEKDLLDQMLSTFDVSQTGKEEVEGIQITTCCSCPTKMPSSQIGKNGWVRYERGKNYASLLPEECDRVDCAPCPPQTSSGFTCPQGEWVDCMPGPDAGIKQECTQEFLNWATIYCPGFKGAAL